MNGRSSYSGKGARNTLGRHGIGRRRVSDVSVRAGSRQSSRRPGQRMLGHRRKGTSPSEMTLFQMDRAGCRLVFSFPVLFYIVRHSGLSQKPSHQAAEVQAWAIGMST